ncbi:sigma-54 dependent transcriptional regulator [Parabacteroides sp. OttesenSCG-928-G07]|nr:sigma-54 dependent transcriptional regulator [Parabacteroides sp. OttesenSCG-928-G21]MDL2278593.1 sigma-54 dependent transcriptional regulator [Parabacteroides sp. OttesenSCG-928-G07]
MPSILIIEDDLTFSLMLSTWLEKKGFRVTAISTVGEGRKDLLKSNFDLVLSDIRLPDGDGIDLLKWSRSEAINTPFIMMTSYAGIQSAVQSMKLGASDYVAKPVNPEELLAKIKEVLSSSTIKNPPSITLKTEAESTGFVMGKSKEAMLMHDHASLVAPTDMSVLITGSSGTGKEYIARYIHENSHRKNAPFIPVDCGAIPKDLAASEFFGHIKGSFTGAIENKTGAFVAAQGGTIFLDEIGNLSYDIQVQLLRALQERKVKPIGSNQEIPINVRLISATNENLRTAIANGDFREDLYHRINEFTIRIPDLKERVEDMPLFADHFLSEANKALHKSIEGFDDDVMQLFQSYPWPGNLRQLGNVIRYATLLSTGSRITMDGLPEEITGYETTMSSDLTFSLKNEEKEKEQIKNALKEAGNNKSKAAQLLGIDRKTLYNKLKIYKIDSD